MPPDTADATTAPPTTTEAPAAPAAPPTEAREAAPPVEKKPAGTPAGKPDPFHRAWTSLGQKEKQLLERERELGASSKRAKEVEDAFALAKDDAPGALARLAEMFGTPDLFERAATAAVSRKRVDPAVAKVSTDMEVLRRDLTIERALPLIAKGRSVEEAAKALGVEPQALADAANDARYSARVEAAVQEHARGVEAVLERHDQQVRAWVAAEVTPEGDARYELIAGTPGADAAVFALIQQHFAETLEAGEAVQLTAEQAADIIEEHLYTQLRQAQAVIASAKRFRSQPAGTAPTAPLPAAVSPVTRSESRTLSNVAAQESSGPRENLSRREEAKRSEREAARVLEQILAGKRASG